MSEGDKMLLAARIMQVVVSTQLKVDQANQTAESMNREVSYLMEKYGANEDQY
jgi:hypothetical protein